MPGTLPARPTTSHAGRLRRQAAKSARRANSHRCQRPARGIGARDIAPREYGVLSASFAMMRRTGNASGHPTEPVAFLQLGRNAVRSRDPHRRRGEFPCRWGAGFADASSRVTVPPAWVASQKSWPARSGREAYGIRRARLVGNRAARPESPPQPLNGRLVISLISNRLGLSGRTRRNASGGKACHTQG